MSMSKETNPQQELSFNVVLRPRIVDYAKDDKFSYTDASSADDVESEAERLANVRRAKQESAIAQMDIDEASSETCKTPLIKARRKVAISTMKSPVPWAGDEPPFRISQGGAFFGLDEIHPAKIVHCMGLGGTGMGKTMSFLAPLMSAQLRYQIQVDGISKSSSMLLIDPKRELLGIATKVLTQMGEGNRLIHIAGPMAGQSVRFFAGDEHLTNHEKLVKLDAALCTKKMGDGSHAFWHQAGLRLVEQFMNLQEDVHEVTGQSLISQLQIGIGLEPAVGNFWAGLAAVLNFSRCSLKKFRATCKALTDALQAPGLSEHPDAAVLESFAMEGDLQQYQYRLQSSEPFVSLLADEEVANVIDFDPFGTSHSPGLDLRQAMDEGKVVVFQPEQRENLTLAARALKAKWYQAVRSRNDMLRPTGLIVDEFQKFITIDALSGDASFLDTARGFRCNVVLATQSVSALVHALGGGREADTAVAAILTNTPSKWFFASKDVQSEDTLRGLIPSPSIPGPHVVNVRSPAQLQPGQAYWSMADGKWGRGRANLAGLL